MKTNGFHASTIGGKRIFAVSIIVALILASVSAMGVFAAPTKISGGQLRELGAAMRWYNNFRSQPGRFNSASDQAKLQQYLDQYAFALRQAQALLVNGGSNSNGQGNNSNGNNASGQGGNSSGQGSNQNGRNQSAEQQMATYLSMMRGLRDKIMSVSGSGNNGNNAGNSSGNNAGAGIPVTGNSTASNSQSNNQSNNQNNNQNNNQSKTPSQIWGGQFRELQAAQTWFNNFRTKPGQNRNSEAISRYLDQYAFALSQARAVIAGGSTSNGQQSNSNGSNGQGNNLSWGTPQQQLSMYLHMMRGLRDKIAGGGNNNNSSNTNNTTGNVQP